MKWQTIFRALFWLLTWAVLIASLLPAIDAPTIFATDKLNHVLAFMVLSFSAKILWPQAKITVLFGLLAILGGGIELAQMSLGFGRDADWADFAADILAIVLGLGAAQTILRLTSNPFLTER